MKPVLPQKGFKNRKVLVFGLGLLGGGVATTNWLLKQGAKVTVTDLKDKKVLASSLKKIRGKVELKLGKHTEEDVKKNDVIVVNPDVSINNPYIQLAFKLGKQVENEATIFFKNFKKPIVAVTGTRGKTTTTNWVAHFLKSRFKASVAGNSYEDPFLKVLDKKRNLDWAVAEVPSFALEFFVPMPTLTFLKFTSPILSAVPLDVRLLWLVNLGFAMSEVKRLLDFPEPSFPMPNLTSLKPPKPDIASLSLPSPNIAVITNIYQEHLNRHQNLENYAGTKANLFRWQMPEQNLILNYDNDWTKFFLKQKPKSRTWFFSSKALPKKLNGIFWRKGKVFFQLGNGVSKLGVLKAGNFVKEWGEHNLYNLLAGSLAAYLGGVAWVDIQKRIKTLPQIPFRQEKVFDDGRLKIINDTTATSPDGGIAAIKRFASPSTVLITGGTDRQLDYKSWARTVLKNIKKENLVLLSGSATEKMIEELRIMNHELRAEETLEECLRKAIALAGKYQKSVILFSPAAKSFEKFKNEYDRGEQFNKLVKKFTKGGFA